MFAQRKNLILITGLLIAGVISVFTLSEPRVLHVWAPAIQNPQGNPARPLMDKIEEKTGITTVLNLSNQIEELLQACAEDTVDHSILAGVDAELAIQRCGFDVIATADVSISLFGKKPDQSLAELNRIGYIARTVSRKIAISELPIEDLESKLIEFPSHQEAVFALFNDKIDSLIINDAVINHLVDNLKNQVTKLTAFGQKGQVYFLVSPQLSHHIKQQLQSLYLSSDPVITRLFYNQAGLAPIHKPSRDRLTKGQ